VQRIVNKIKNIILSFPRKYKTETDNRLTEYSKIGLRTLVCCKKEIDAKSYKKWSQDYKVSTTISYFILIKKVAKEKVDKTRKATMEAYMDIIEKDMELIGATAIEDKLQDQVGPTIRYLKEAGIKLWVLTGDKVETAINIGFSTQVLDPSLDLLKIRGKNPCTLS
jgi:phospholipid-transporting ATPase